jgi:hypothetical protein
MKWTHTALASAVALAIGIAGCDRGLTTPQDSDYQTVAPAPDLASASMTSSNAPFPAWKQGFNHGTEGWTGSDVAGPAGFCGTIEQVDRRELDRGAIMPSVGRGHALAKHGECNEFWGELLPASGPYSPGAGYSTRWPPSGYIMELDLHLDPEAGSEGDALLNYFVSISLLDVRNGEFDFEENTEASIASLRYYGLPVTFVGGALSIGGYQVTDPGWYTFRHTFSEDHDGKLAVTFTLAQRGRTLFSTVLPETPLNGEPTSPFAASNVGSGYIWLDLAEGVELPIDEHQVRRGS